MQRTKYFQWIGIAVIAIGAVVLFLILSLKNNKHQNQPSDTATALPSASPATNASDAPTAAPSTSPTVTPVTNSKDHTALARAAYASKQYTTAISEYTQAISATSAATDLATLWNELGNTYRDNQSLIDAVSAYDKALSSNPLLGDAYLNKAAVQWSQEKKDDAIATLQAGIDKNATRKQDLQSTLDVYQSLNR